MNNETLRERIKQGDFKDIENWDVSNVTDMNGLFFPERFNEFNEDISNWDVGNVTDMRRMFSGCFRFNQDIGGWDVSKVTDMQEMFAYIESFNQDIGGWDVSNVTNMSNMFAYAESFDKDIDNWDVSKVTDMSQMFTYDSALFKCHDTWKKWESKLQTLVFKVRLENFFYEVEETTFKSKEDAIKFLRESDENDFYTKSELLEIKQKHNN